MAWETPKKTHKTDFLLLLGACTYTFFFISLLHFVGFNNAFLCNFDGDGMENVYMHRPYDPHVSVCMCDHVTRVNSLQYEESNGI